MGDARHEFLSGLIDYAGLFPPAALDLPAAVREYAAHRRDPDAWMLGSFIVPAGRLSELDSLVDELCACGGEPGPCRLSALIGVWPADLADGAAVLERIRAEATAVREFEARHPGAVRVGALETRLPDDVLAGADGGSVVPYLVGLRAALAGGRTGAPLDDRELFVELPGGADPPPSASLAAAVAAVAQCDRAGRTESRGVIGRLGVKLRCGGVTADAFPPPEHVARTIVLCRDGGVALKCTAGLHHPLRRPAPEYGAVMHGFVNVFGAGLLAAAGLAEEKEILACVAEEEPDAFALDAGGFAWRERRLDAQRVRRGRRELMVGYGSCSFDEPRADLRALGWLD